MTYSLQRELVLDSLLMGWSGWVVRISDCDWRRRVGDVMVVWAPNEKLLDVGGVMCLLPDAQSLYTYDEEG